MLRLERWELVSTSRETEDTEYKNMTEQDKD